MPTAFPRGQRSQSRNFIPHNKPRIRTSAPSDCALIMAESAEAFGSFNSTARRISGEIQTEKASLLASPCLADVCKAAPGRARQSATLPAQ